jgi:hypothetical protein
VGRLKERKYFNMVVMDMEIAYRGFLRLEKKGKRGDKDKFIMEKD